MWDEPWFRASVVQARKSVEDTAHVIHVVGKRADWVSHRPGVELVFYLAVIDYETKVLIHRLMTSPDDRYVWEKYLALHLHEALDQVPRRVSQAIQEVKRPGTASRADLGAHEAAARGLRDAVKPIRQDPDFMTALNMILNSEAAHHGGEGEESLDAKHLLDADVKSRGLLWTNSASEPDTRVLHAIPSRCAGLRPCVLAMTRRNLSRTPYRTPGSPALGNYLQCVGERRR